MSKHRYYKITRSIRFDDYITRAQRLVNNKCAAISEIWNLLNVNLKRCYTASECVVVDEQLYPCRNRTKFTQCMPSKPAKYGIKIWWVCDAASSYPLTGQIYTGKSEEERETNIGERVVKDLCFQFRDSGRNVTVDNFFTSLPLVRLLLSWKLSLVDTLKKNKTCIPPQMLDKKRDPLSSLFGFSEDKKVTI